MLIIDPEKKKQFVLGVIVIVSLFLLWIVPTKAAIQILVLGGRIDFIGDVGGAGDCDVQPFSLFDVYTFETDGSYPLLLTSAAVSYPKAKLLNASATDFTDITDEINNGTEEDFALPPLNSTGIGTTIYIGSTDRSPNGIRINITTPGSGIWTISCARSMGTSTWGQVICYDDTLDFTVSGVNDISFSANPSVKGTVNGVSAYWYRINITSFTSVVTYPMASQIWIRYNAPTQPRPFDYYYTSLSAVVTNFNNSGNGSFYFLGDTATAETSELLQISGNGSFPTYQKYSGLYFPAYAMSGKFSWQIYQSRAGAMSQLTTGTGEDKQYYLYGRTNLSSSPSDGSYKTCWTEIDKYLYYRSMTNPITVYNNSEINWGQLVSDDEDGKVTSDGVYVTGMSTNYLQVYDGGKMNWYGGGMRGGNINASNLTAYNLYFDGTQLRGCRNCDLYGNTFSGAGSSIYPANEISGTFDNNRFIGTSGVLYVSKMGTSNILFTNTYIRNGASSFEIGIAGIGSNPYWNYTFRDTDYDRFDKSTMAFYVANDIGRAWLFEDYTPVLNVIYPNGTVFPNATVEVSVIDDGLYVFNETINISTAQMCYIQNLTALTDYNGNWTAIMLYKFSRANATSTTLQNIQCNYNFKISKAGYQTLDFNLTIPNGKGRPYLEPLTMYPEYTSPQIRQSVNVTSQNSTHITYNLTIWVYNPLSYTSDFYVDYDSQFYSSGTTRVWYQETADSIGYENPYGGWWQWSDGHDYTLADDGDWDTYAETNDTEYGAWASIIWSKPVGFLGVTAMVKDNETVNYTLGSFASCSNILLNAYSFTTPSVIWDYTTCTESIRTNNSDSKIYESGMYWNVSSNIISLSPNTSTTITFTKSFARGGSDSYIEIDAPILNDTWIGNSLNVSIPQKISEPQQISNIRYCINIFKNYDMKFCLLESSNYAIIYKGRYIIL